MPLIPFFIWPYSWGLKGDARKKAKLEYLYTGKELEYKLVSELNYDTDEREFLIAKLDFKYNIITKRQFEYKTFKYKNPLASDNDLYRENIRLDLKYNIINQEKYDREILDLDFIDTDNKIEYLWEELKLDLKYNKINQEEYDKKSIDLKYNIDLSNNTNQTLAYKKEILSHNLKYNKINQFDYVHELETLNEHPHIKIYGEFDFRHGIYNGLSMIMEWNEYFINLLSKEGYTGANISDTDIIDMWWEDLCRKNLGISDVQSEEMSNQNDPYSLIKERRPKIERSETGNMEIF